MDKDLSGIARFNGDEFHIWKWQIKTLLLYKKVFGVPNGTDLEEDATDKEAWQEREYLAYSILCNSVERKILGSLLDCTTSREIWTTLLSLYEHNTSKNLHDIQKKFFQAAILPEQSITDFIASLNLILSELTALGDETFNEYTMISKLLSSLPEGFDHFLTSWESSSADEQTLLNLKLRLIKEERKIKKHLLNETTATTSAFYSYTPDHRGRGRLSHNLPSRGFSHNSSRGLSLSGRGLPPTGRGFTSNSGRGVSSFRRGGSFLDSRRPSRPLPRYSAAELAHVKQHTRCIECGEYGHWRQECPHLFPINFESINNFNSTRVHFADVSSSSFSSDSSVTPEITSLLVDTLPSHDEDFHDTVEQLQLDDSYLEAYSDPSAEQSTYLLSRGYMALSSSATPNILLDVWIADSGANQHMSHKFEWFTSYTPLSAANSWPITSIVGHKTYVAGTGTICFLLQLPDRTEIFSLDNVLYVPGLDCNLFSTTAIANKYGFIFTGGANSCTFTKDSELYLTGRLKHDMYIMDLTVLLPQTISTHANSFGNILKTHELQSIQTWHHRFAHLNFEMIKQMERRGSVIGLQLSKRTPDHLCVGCQFGKHHRTPFFVNHVRERFPKPGDLIHGDTCGPMSVPSHGGSIYFVLFKDDATLIGLLYVYAENLRPLPVLREFAPSLLKTQAILFKCFEQIEGEKSPTKHLTSTWMLTLFDGSILLLIHRSRIL